MVEVYILAVGYRVSFKYKGILILFYRVFGRIGNI